MMDYNTIKQKSHQSHQQTLGFLDPKWCFMVEVVMWFSYCCQIYISLNRVFPVLKVASYITACCWVEHTEPHANFTFSILFTITRSNSELIYNVCMSLPASRAYAPKDHFHHGSKHV